MSYAIAILASLASSFIALAWCILLFASMPNSSDAQFAEIRNWIIAVAVVTAGGVGCAIWLMVAKRPWLAVSLGGAPALLSLLSFLHLLRAQR